MRCTIEGCSGDYEARRVARALRHGGKTIVVEGIPAEVCNVCGDVLFAPDTIEQLEQLQMTPTAPVGQAAIYRFPEKISV